MASGTIMGPEDTKKDAAGRIGAETGREFGEALGEAAGRAFATVAEETVETVKREARAKVDETKAQVREVLPTSMSDLRSLTHRYPLEMVGGAFFLGLLFGRR